MTKILIICILLLFNTSLQATENEITTNIDTPTITKFKIDELHCSLTNQICEIWYYRGYTDINTNNFVAIDEKIVKFEGDDYKNFVNYITQQIRTGDSFLLAITKAVKIKLGL